MILLADPNSVLHEMLDSVKPVQHTWEDSYYYTATKAARAKE